MTNDDPSKTWDASCKQLVRNATSNDLVDNLGTKPGYGVLSGRKQLLLDQEEGDQGTKGDEENKTDDNLANSELQLSLTEEELETVHERVLSTTDPRLPPDTIVFSHRHQEFVPLLAKSSLTVLLEREGECNLQCSFNAPSTTSDDAEEEDVGEPEAEEDAEEVGSEKGEDAASDDEAKEGEDEADGEGAADEIDVQIDVSSETKGKKKLVNKFNYSERGSQTYPYVEKENGSQTSPPPRANFAHTANQWVIYDAYQKDFNQTQKEKEREKRDRLMIQTKKESHIQKKGTGDEARDEVIKKRLVNAAKILERMVNQNIFDEIAQDLQYYDDPADKYRKTEGSVLPLWTFKYPDTDKMTVTDICWNPSYFDLFAVSYGSFAFGKIVHKGYICVFSLKNPSYPEYIGQTCGGIVCLSFHQKKTNYIAAGLDSGGVAVFDIMSKTVDPTHTSDVNTKHRAETLQVVWGEDESDRVLVFFSVSADGHVYKWGIVQNDLRRSPVITLFMDIEAVQSLDGSLIKIKASGTCLVFHPKNPGSYLVGTREGNIYKCNVAYSSSYLFTYMAHRIGVNRIHYNYFLNEIFISCSEDWTVKIWEDNREDPLFTFDLDSPVGDVQWAPYSSTVFGAVTADGNVHIYDLNVNKYDAICVQLVVSNHKNILTRFKFNAQLPIFIAGDSKGAVVSSKVSPNCRIKPKPPKKQMHIDPLTLELWKLEKVLSYVREPEATPMLSDKDSVKS